MLPDTLLIIHVIFKSAWMLFTSWDVPGTNVSPAEWCLFSLTVYFIVTYIRVYITGGDGKE